MANFTLTAEDKLSLIKKVLIEGYSVSEACKLYNVSRFSYYKWLSHYDSSLTDADNLINLKIVKRTIPKYYGQVSETIEKTVKEIALTNPGLSKYKIAELLRDRIGTKKAVGVHGVYNILRRNGLNTSEKRAVQRAATGKLPRRILTPMQRFEIINKALNNGLPVAQVCRDYGVSRFTFYKWKKRWEAGSRQLDTLKDKKHDYDIFKNRVKPEHEQTLINLVIETPNLSKYSLAERLSQKVGEVVGPHGVYNILLRNNLTRPEERLAYANSVISPSIAGVSDTNNSIEGGFGGTFAGPTEPITVQGITGWKVFGLLVVLPILIFAFTYGGVWWFEFIISQTFLKAVGYSFSLLALTVGSLFFLYSLKYYMSLILVLSYSDLDQEKNSEKLTVNKIISRILGITQKSEDKFSSAKGLTTGLEDITLENKPFVSVHIPFYNEKNVVRRSVEAAANLNYPNYEIVLADDSTDETTSIIREYQNKYLFKNEDIKEVKGDGWVMTQVEIKPGILLKHIHRTSRSGFKGAALDLALKLSNPKTEFISVYDADFVPYTDSLEMLLKYFKVQNNMSEEYSSSNVAAVQGYQWHVLNKSENWITRGVRSEYAGSYVVERSGTEIYGGLKQISGSVYMIRKAPLTEVGWGRSITEDFELTLRLYEKGYKVLYTPYIQAPSECVSTINRLIRQRMRWAEGHSFNIKKMFRKLIVSPRLTMPEKMELMYLSPYYLQSLFLMIGTFAWIAAEIIFRVHLPFWTELWGWSLILTNFLALPLVNAVGLFIEESGERDYTGLASFIFLSYLLVPFQGYAALKGFMEKSEGPWFRTPKSGRITDIFTRGRFYRFLSGILPGSEASFDFGITEGSAYLSLTTSHNKFDSDPAGPESNKSHSPLVRQLVLSFAVVLILMTLNLLQLEGDGNYNVNFLSAVSLPFGGRDKLIPTKKVFNFDESPRFNLYVGSNEKSGVHGIGGILSNKVYAEGLGDVKTEVIYRDAPAEATTHITKLPDGSYTIDINKPSLFKPGKYTLKATYNLNGRTEKFAQDFRWGVIAMNTNKDAYLPGETVKVGFGIVDDAGRTICNAKLSLVVKSPVNGVSETLTSDNGRIKQSGDCAPKSVTNTPDYYAIFTAGQIPETYELHLKAETYNGEKETEGSLKVVGSIPFVVERNNYPTRVFPDAMYPVSVKITPNEDFRGEVKDYLPPKFDAIEISSGGFFDKNDDEMNQKSQPLSWKVDWRKGETYTLSYTILFPQVSPAYYELGPLSLTPKSAPEAIYREQRYWQIAADALAHVQTAYKTNAASTTCNPAFAGNVTAGSLLVASARLDVASANITGVADTLSNTWNNANGKVTDATVNISAYTWYSMNTGAGADTITMTADATVTNFRCAISEYSGVATTNALDQVNSKANTTNSTSQDTNSVTTTVNNELIYAFYGVGSGQDANPYTAGTCTNTCTLRGSFTTKIAVEDQFTTATATLSNPVTTGTSVKTLGLISTYADTAVPENWQLLLGLSPVMIGGIVWMKRKQKYKK